MSGEIFTIEVPMLAPSINKAYPANRQGRRFLSKEGKAYKELVGLMVRTKRWKVRTDCIYKLTIECFSPRWYTKSGAVFKHDVSNHLKIAEDAFCEACSIDDSLVFEVHLIKRVGPCEKTFYSLGEIGLD